MEVKKGSVVLACFEPSIGREIQKIRPALIIQSDIACKYSSLFTLVPITGRDYAGKHYEVLLEANTSNNLAKNSVALINQVNSFDKSRIIKVIGSIDNKVLEEVYQKIDLHFGR